MAKIFNRACQYCSGARRRFEFRNEPPPKETAAAAQPSSVGTASAQVTIQALKYSPETIEIRKGETVEWINNDLAPHTVTSQAADTFNSGAIDPDSSWSHTFSQPGTFPYYCTFHPEMKATVNVK